MLCAGLFVGASALTDLAAQVKKPLPRKNVPFNKNVTTTLPNGIKLIEKVVRKGNEIAIPYEKYQLANGLVVIVHEDHSDPIVHVDVTYHVGSAREEISKSGFAHFFEHMMFQGSDNVGDEQHFKIVTESGGTLNGTTNRDRTNYFETLPSNQLERALWLESDRMGFLLDAVTQKKFEVQRATVKNERGQNYDNRPYGLVGEFGAKNLYPYGHPYSWLTIGYIQDLDRVVVDDLKNFFLRWYGPNNATLTVGGDVKPADVLKLAEKYFGSIPRGAEVTDTKLPAVVLEKDRYVSLEDNYIKLPLLSMTFPTVEAHHVDEPALDCLAEILGQGTTSILYQKFVKTQKAAQASANNSTSELAGEFSMSIVPFPGQKLADMEKMVRESFADFEKKGVTDEDLAKFLAGMESQFINGMASVSGKVSQLASYQTYENNPNFFQTEIKRYRSIKKEDVMRVYNQYIKGKACVILSVYPKGQKDVAAEDNYKVNESGYTAPNYGYAGLKYNKAKDNFDRTKKPASGANPVVKVPPYYQKTLNNGLKVIGTKNSETPTVTLALSIKGGQMHATNDLDKAGLASMFAQMMNEGTQKYDSEQFSTELDKLGSSIRFFAGEGEINVQIQSLKKNIDKTLELFEEKLLHPKFTQEDFDRLKKQTLQGIKNQQTQPTFIASDVYNKVLYGQNHIKAVAMSGTEKTVAAFTLADVQAYYDKFIVPNVSNLVVVGDLEDKEAFGKISFLEKWTRKEVIIPTYAPAKAIDKTRVYLVNKDKAAQSEIRIGYVTSMPFDATGEYYRATVANYILGGAFNSRVNLNLREDKGWSYGVRTGFSANNIDGRFTASGGVKANTSDSSVVEFMKEMKLYAEKGITEEELAFTKSSIGQSDALKYETGFQKAGFLSRIIDYNLSKTFVDEQNKILSAITKEELDALSRKLVTTDKMAIVVVGDKKLIFEGIKKLGYEVIELDVNGNVVVEQATIIDPKNQVKEVVEEKVVIPANETKKQRKAREAAAKKAEKLAKEAQEKAKKAQEKAAKAK